MKHLLVVPVALVLAMGGCATKKYVRTTTEPIQAKVDQVGEQTNRNTTAIDESRKQIKGVDERAESGISAAKERAMTAEARANEAMTKATQADSAAAEARSLADRANNDLGALRNVVSGIDDFKLASEATVNFGFNKHQLSKEAKAELDKVASAKGEAKRYVISVEGFTDKTGTPDYNLDLSKKRAEAVVSYLVTQHGIPVYRIYTIGLGKERPVEEANNRAARAKNRRVEVKIFSADLAGTATRPASADSGR